MMSLVNPVAVKELRERLRGRRAVFILSAYLFVLFLIALFVLSVAVPESAGLLDTWELGRTLFWTLAFFELTAACLISPAFAAASITGEREKQTFDMLEATLLTPRQILTGKLISSTAFVLYLVAAALPMASIVFGLGGVSLADFFTALAVIAAASYFYASFGLYCSAVFKRTIASVGITIITLVLATIITGPIIPIIEGFNTSQNVPLSFLAGLNPFIELLFVSEKAVFRHTLIGGLLIPFWVIGLVLLVLGGTHFLAAGTARLGRLRQDRSMVYRINFFVLITLCVGLLTLSRTVMALDPFETLAAWAFFVLTLIFWSLPFFFGGPLQKEEEAPVWRLPLLALRPLAVLRNRNTTALTYLVILLGAQFLWLIPLVARDNFLFLADRESLVTLVEIGAVMASAATGWGLLCLGASRLLRIRFAARGILLFGMVLVTLGSVIPWFPHHVLDMDEETSIVSETFRSINPYYGVGVPLAEQTAPVFKERAVNPVIPAVGWNVLIGISGLALWEVSRRVRKGSTEDDSD